MEYMIIKNRIANKRNPGYLDQDQLDSLSEVAGFGLYKYIDRLRKERRYHQKGDEIDRALFRISRSCYKYEHFGVRPVLSEAIAWMIQAEVLNCAEIDFVEVDPCSDFVGVTVEQFLREHPDATLNLATPGGYVSITPEQRETLLNGGQTGAHAGSSDSWQHMSADELLGQVI